VKKFLNAEAFKMLEKFLIIHQANPQWFSNFGLQDPRMKELFESEYIFPLKQRDQNGCRVVMIKGRKLDPKKYNANDAYKIISWVGICSDIFVI
jgi:poly-D-alanine transfer protein DltD